MLAAAERARTKRADESSAYFPSSITVAFLM